ncbi:MAG: ribosome recycling factor [Oscillospiraceae bacterium]|nr:ribosome recycling factor [Oscillospiraceae bacterium]
MSAQTKPYEEKMTGAVAHLVKELATIRAGRANPAVIDHVTVDYYGTPTPINQLAAIAVTEARILTIQPWEANMLSKIEKAILTSDIGINPTNDGRIMRLVFPAPTEDRRRELCKEVSKIGEETKIAVRNIRRDAIDKFKTQKKNSEITEDDLKGLEEAIQKLTDKFTKEIDATCAAKEKEVMEL